MMKRFLFILLAIGLIAVQSLSYADNAVCPECRDEATDMLYISSTEDDHTLECFCGKHYTLPHEWLDWHSNGDGTHTRYCVAGCAQTQACSGGTADCTHYAACTVCGGPHGELNTEAHVWDNGSVTVAPTCRSLGAMTYTCLHNPAHTYTDAIEVDPDAHFFRDGVVVVPATCSHEGVKKYTCLYSAQHTKEEPIPIDPNAHRWDKGVVLSVADCTTGGETLFTCLEDPSHTRTVTTDVDLSQHVWYKRIITREATCTRDGMITLVCERDPSHTGTESIPATGHNWTIAIVTKQPTCTEPGVMTYTCNNDSSHTYTEPIPATGHRWGNMEIVSEPTCIAEGEKTYVCGYDADHKTTIRLAVDPNAHDYQPTGQFIELPGACRPGQAQITRCTLCGSESYQVVTEPSSHVYSSWTSGGSAHTAVCDFCGGAPISFICNNSVSTPCPICLDAGVPLASIGSVRLTDMDDSDDYHAIASAGGGLLIVGLYDTEDHELVPEKDTQRFYVHLSAEQLAEAFQGSTDMLSKRALDILTSDSLRVVRYDDLVLIRNQDDRLLLHVMHHAADGETDEMFCHISNNAISFQVPPRHWNGHELTIWLELEEP